jgi:GR25 family glycosyltransferase involved in LPS biosynthesis
MEYHIKKGYVINLKKRKDRLNKFKNEVSLYLPKINISVIDAIDGSLINLNDEFYKKNVNKWNFDNLCDSVLRGVIGCCLSHLKCYELISKNDDEYVIIFEDDCIFRSNKHKKIAQESINNLKFPEKFGIIFLNKSTTTQIEANGNLNRILYAPTTESYIINKEYAKILYKENINNIGAIDAHIGQMTCKYPEYPMYQLVNGLFIQYDSKDSNIQLTRKKDSSKKSCLYKNCNDIKKRI